MEEHTQEIEVPHFARRKEYFITTILKQQRKTGPKYEWEEYMRELNLFCVTIYPDGEKPESEGYVSLVFDRFGFIHDIPYRLKSLQCTVSVVDVSGGPRFAKSFGMNVEQIREGKEEWNFLPSVRLERFIRRRVLLNSHEELLPEDRLTLRCDVIWWYDSKQEKILSMDYWRNVYATTAKQESWFIGDKKSDDGYWLLDLRTPESQLCTRLREQSDFFEALFRWPCKEMKDGHLPVHKSKYDVFFNMLCYIRFENLQHIGSVWEYCDLYEKANRYGVLELQEICCSHLKRHLTYGCAIQALRAAGLCCDAELRTIAFRLALSYWKDVRGCVGGLYSDFSEIKELICAARILNLERETGDTLRDLAARQVLLYKKEAQHYPTWSEFESEMPDLAKVILSLDTENTLDLYKKKTADEFKENALSYDFYS